MHFVQAKSLLSRYNGMNIYRGCTHGCIYCDSRSRCYGMEHAFTDIEVKQNAPELLEDALRRKRSKCMIGTGSMCDPYIPLEEKLRLTRRCIELVDQYGFGFTVITKSARVLRDLDLLQRINNKTKCVVQMTLTTFDEDLCRVLEPNVSTTHERFETLKTLRDHGIPTVVWLDPILPFINDTEENLRGILGYCAEAGVHGIICFGMGLTLREGNREYFYAQLDKHFPGLKQRYQTRYGLDYSITSPNNAVLMRIYHDECARHGIMTDNNAVFAYLHAFEDKHSPQQLSLFE
jgi:DNA repair photolyase